MSKVQLLARKYKKRGGGYKQKGGLYMPAGIGYGKKAVAKYGKTAVDKMRKKKGMKKMKQSFSNNKERRMCVWQ